jgi:hypothetical protein
MRTLRRIRKALTSPPALAFFAIFAGFVVGLATTPPEYEGVKDEAVFRKILGMYSAQVMRFIRDIAIGTVAIAAVTAAVAAIIARGFRIESRRRQALWLAGGWYLFLLASCLRAPALFNDSLMRLPIFDRRFVFLLSRVPVLSHAVYYSGLYLLPIAVFVALLWAVARLRGWRWSAALLIVPFVVLIPHLVTVIEIRALKRPTPSDKKSVLIIAIDSLRSDYVGKNAGGRPITPQLEALASRSLYFPETIVSIPRTAPSLTSIFVSQYPMKTGVSSMFPAPEHWDQSQRSLATHFRQAGYYTFAVSDYVGEFLGKVNVGFERVAVPTVELPEIVEQSVLLHQPLLMGVWMPS